MFFGKYIILQSCFMSAMLHGVNCSSIFVNHVDQIKMYWCLPMDTLALVVNHYKAGHRVV